VGVTLSPRSRTPTVVGVSAGKVVEGGEKGGGEEDGERRQEGGGK